jgi:hypothetical protein
MRERLFSFWGGKLGYVEKLCLASMVKAGHAVDVYSYDAALELPPGVTLRPAAEIIEEKHVVRHENGSLALFSDIFRYTALQKEAGIWVDLDVMLLRPLTGLGDFIYAWQDENIINGAILKLPPDSKVLKSLVDLARARVVIGPYWRRRDKAVQIARGLVGRAVPLSKLEWGIIGPRALTHYLRANGIDRNALPASVFYPVRFTEAQDLFNLDAAEIEALLAPETRAVHIWNDMIKELKKTAPPAGSFIDRKCRQFDIASA